MTPETVSKRIWPYVLPFPLDPKKRRLIWSILQSRVGLRILGKIGIDGRTYQHNLIEKLPYSNKSTIGYLKKMVEAGLLEQGMEVSTERNRSVWVKWYKPTSMGKWLVLFLKSPKEVSPDLTRAIIGELFHLYASSIVEVCQKSYMDIDSFHRDLDKQYSLEIAKKQHKFTPEVAVFGSVAMDTYGSLKRLPESDELVYVEETGRYPGGMGANVAVALSRLNIPVTFFGRIGSDPNGRMLLENLSRHNIDLSNIHFVDAPSVQTLILSDGKSHRWLLAISPHQSAISLESIEEINLKVLDSCKVVYVGEVFVEIASAIADYARTRNKIVVYRPGAPYMQFGLEKLRKILDRATIFILNEAGWKQLKMASGTKIESPADLLGYGLESVVLTKGSEGCEVFSENKRREFSVPPRLQAKFRMVDPTGAGDGFSAGLIRGVMGRWSMEKTVSYAQAVASITCSRIGAGNSFPTEEEVEAAVSMLA